MGMEGLQQNPFDEFAESFEQFGFEANIEEPDQHECSSSQDDDDDEEYIDEDQAEQILEGAMDALTG